MNDDNVVDLERLMRAREDARDVFAKAVKFLLSSGLDRAAVVMGLGDTVSEVIGHSYGRDAEQGELLNVSLQQFMDVVRAQAQWHQRGECQQDDIEQPAQAPYVTVPNTGRVH